MATFDSTAFDAVANFFGGSDNSDKKKNVDTDSIKDELNMLSRGGSKLGVGAEIKKEVKEVSTKDKFMKRVLQKKRRRNDEDDDTDDEISVSRTYDSDNNSEEEEKGRTSIAKAKLSIPTALLTEQSSSTKKKKKKKKKKKLVKETSLEIPSPPVQEKGVGESSIASEKEMTEKIEVVEIGEEKKVPEKFKRKKVRSKQKNIRKDTRRAIDKPSHLILGRSNYAGRPITKETRLRLDMPERVRYNGKKCSVQQSIDPIPGEGTLAIDNFLKVEGDEAVKFTANEVKKKKKSKYKNLQ